MNERELIDAIQLVVGAGAPGVRVGIGDDAAVVDPGAGDLVLATDMLVEGVDLSLESANPRDIGAKAIAVNLSDLAAMGASPRYALISLALPPGIDVPWVVDLFGGMRDVCEGFACAIVGGDLSSSKEFVVSVAVAGSVAPGSAVTRSGALAGDVLVVTGPLGAAAGGLLLSLSDDQIALTPDGRGLVEAQLRPIPRVAEGQFLASRGAHAMIDLSDGLSRDLHRLCRASGVGATLDASAIPVDPRLAALLSGAGSTPLDLALTGGEDFALLAALPAAGIDAVRTEFEERFFQDLVPIGRVTEALDVCIGDGEGNVDPLRDQGWDHFA